MKGYSEAGEKERRKGRVVETERRARKKSNLRAEVGLWPVWEERDGGERYLGVRQQETREQGSRSECER